MAHIRQSGPDSGIGFQVKALKFVEYRSLFARQRVGVVDGSQDGAGWGSEFRVHGLGCGIRGFGLRVQVEG